MGSSVSSPSSSPSGCRRKDKNTGHLRQEAVLASDEVRTTPRNATRPLVNPKTEEIAREATAGIRSKLVRHKFIDDIWSLYENIRVLGEGMTGCVVEVKKKANGKIYAMKQMKKSHFDSTMLDSLRLEIDLLKEMDHPNTIKLFDTYEDKSKFFLIMEECTGGELFDHLTKQEEKKYTEAYAAQLVMHMLRAIAYVHSKGIAHRDLKLENFVFESEDSGAQLKLIDFGLSKRYAAGGLRRMKSIVGTPYYIAPEILKGEGYGKPPFNDASDHGIMNKVIRGKFDMPANPFSRTSEELKEFIRGLMVDPKRRMTATEAMQHPWMTRMSDHSDGAGDALSAEIVGSLINYKNVSKMKQTALEVISFSLSMDEIKQLRTAFEAIDADGNGIITMDEMQVALTKAGVKGGNLEELFQSIDTNCTGLISYSEFIAASIRKKMYQSEDELIEAFNRLDVDGNGFLELDDFQKLLGDEFDSEEVKKMIESADKSKDGRIDFQEFVMMMREQNDTHYMNEMKQNVTHNSKKDDIDSPQ